jgi:hypothetical protein
VYLIKYKLITRTRILLIIINSYPTSLKEGQVRAKIVIKPLRALIYTAEV